MANTAFSIRQLLGMAQNQPQLLLLCGVLLLCLVYSINRNAGLMLAGLVLLIFMTNKI